VKGAQKRIVEALSSWKDVAAAPHRFGGTEFRLGNQELGHVHGDYQADIAFPMDVRNKLVEEGKAEPHHVLPRSGWITFRFRNDGDVENAIDLFRQSYDLAMERNRKLAPTMP
jgi:hypothetical protein